MHQLVIQFVGTWKDLASSVLFKRISTKTNSSNPLEKFLSLEKCCEHAHPHASTAPIPSLYRCA